MKVQLIFAAIDDSGNWRFGIGDPTAIGWFTVAAYALATLACGWVWVTDRRASAQGRLTSPAFWMVLTFLLLFLGINKQLDLQTLLNDVGRRLAKAQGWYASRRVYQTAFIAIVTLAGLLALAGFCWMGRKEWRRNLVALVGTIFLYVFVLIRASSIHHVDAMLQWTWMGWKWNWILELGGISVVGLGACLARWKGPERRPAAGAVPGPDDAKGPRRYKVNREPG